MKLSPLILPIIVCVFISVDVHGRRCKRRITYVKQSHPVLPPPPTPAFNYQSFDEDLSGRDAFAEINTGTSSVNSANSQHPNLSCLLFADDGCSVSCGLMCDINGCQSDGFCSQKFYCLCNEVYIVQNRPVTADQFRKLNFDELWDYKFKSTNNSPNPRNRIFQNDELYRFVMPMLQNPHKSGRDIKEALISKYPKLSSAQNLQPREHGIRAKLFGSGNEGEENLHKYIQKMMNTIQNNSVYDRLSHTRYMRRIINLIKNINDKNDLSYILRQIRQTGNDRLFERVRRYLIKRGYYFNEDLKPICKKSGFCAKKKAKCKCRKKSKPKRFFYNYGTTSIVDDGDSDWVEDEDEVIEIALINELIGGNNAEGNYPSTTIVDEQPTPDLAYTTPAENNVPSVILDTTIVQQPQKETVVEMIPEEVTRVEGNLLVSPSDTEYIITSNGPEYTSTWFEEPIMFAQPSNYPEYGTFFNGANNNYIQNRPNSSLPSKQFINYQTQQIPSSQNLNIHPQPLPTSLYFDKPSLPTPTSSLNQATPPGMNTIYQNPDQPTITSSQNSIIYSKPSFIPQNLETHPHQTPAPSIITSQNLNQLPQTTIAQPTVTEVPLDLLNSQPNLKKSPQLLVNPIKTQISQDLTPAITPPSQKLEIENIPQPISIPPMLPKPQPIVSPSQNLLQQFVTEKPTPKIIESSPYLDKSPVIENLKTFEIPDEGPSIESLFVKHNQSPGKTETTNNPESYAEYLLENERPTSLPSSEPIPMSKSHTQFTKTPLGISPHQPTLLEAEIPTSYPYHSESTNFDSSPVLPHSSNTFSEIQIQSPTTSSPPIMQRPKDKIYYQLLMDENGNIIKSANYKYPGQPQYVQDMPQIPSTPLSQYSTITTNHIDQPLFDKFDKHTILNAAKSKPGDSVVIDYDMETTDNIPVFDIPSDIDMDSGTFQVSPDAFGNGDYILEHDIPNNNGFKTLPNSYANDYAYEIQGNSQMNNEHGSGIILPNGELQYAYEIDGDNANEIPNNFEMMGPGQPYPYEVDRDSNQIQTNDGLTLDYEGDGAEAGGNRWSTYSINEGDSSANYPYYDEDISTMYNGPGFVLNGNQEIQRGVNSGDGRINIEILDGSGDIDGASLGHESSYTSSMQSESFSSNGKGNQILPNMNSNENGITIDIMDTSDAADGNTNKFKSGSSSSSTIIKTSSQKTIKATNNNTIPIKISENTDHNTQTDAENNSAACDLPEDPEDDLMNF